MDNAVWFSGNTILICSGSSATVTLSEIFFLIGIIMRKENYEYSGGYDEYINCCNDVDGNEFFLNSIPHA